MNAYAATPNHSISLYYPSHRIPYRENDTELFSFNQKAERNKGT